jgi:hypothetical protein
MNNKGQTVLSEHVMIFFVVVAALVTMTTFVQRGFEARIHDARNFMINSVMNNNVCDSNCMAATGNQIGNEYEPYYTQLISDTERNEEEYKGATQGSPAAIGAIYVNTMNEESKTFSISGQLPSECAGPNPPSVCGQVITTSP